MVAKLKKGWVGPLYQVKEGKRHWACDYIHPLSGKKKREWIAKAETNKKDREDRRHDFKRSLTDGRTLTQENATFNDALDAYLKWCEQLHKANDRMSAGTLERIGHTIRKHLRPDLGRLALWSSGHSGLTEDAVYHLARQKRIPTFRMGRTVCARRSTLAKHIAELEAESSKA